MFRFLQTVSIAGLAMLFLIAGASVSRGQEAAVNQETTEKITAIIRSTSDKVRTILRSDDYKEPEKRLALRVQIRQVFLDISDMRRISLLTLGMNRRQLDDQQFESFIEVFSQLLFSTYITHLERSPDQDLEIRKFVRLSETRCQIGRASCRERV